MPTKSSAPLRPRPGTAPREGDAERAWAKALDGLPHGLDLNQLQARPALRDRLEVLVGGSVTPEAWSGLDPSVRREVAERLGRAGIAPGDLRAEGGRGERATRTKVGAPPGSKSRDGFERDLDLAWSRLVDELPFNLYYNTVNPPRLRAEQKRELEGLIEDLGDRSPFELPGWKDLPDPIRNALAYHRIRFHLDPNASAPITRDEWRAIRLEARKEVLGLLQSSGFGIAQFQRPGSAERHAGRRVENVAPRDSGRGDDRTFEVTSAVTSLANVVTPVLSRPLAPSKGGDGPGSFDFERNRIVDEAQRFLVTRYYGFEREDYADRLLAAAKRGVRVEVEMHPPETAVRRRQQQAVLARLEAARREDPKVAEHLSVSKSTIVPHDPEKQFPQIMHEKSVIADTPDGTLVELQGGINGGGNSPNNLDFAMRIEGAAVLDALRKYLSFRSTEHTASESVAEAMIAAHPRTELEKRTTDKARAEGAPLTKVALGGGGQRRVPAPETYRPAELRARAEAGLSINLDIHDVARFSHLTEKGQNPKWVVNEAMGEVLTTALRNGSAVTLTVPRDDESIDGASYDAIKEATAPFRRMGALVCWNDTVIRDTSYQNLVYANLDRAIERGESCDVAAFALTDAGVMERLVQLHRKHQSLPEGERPKVRVAVHDLEIDDYSVNQKVAALTTAGLDVRVFTDLDAVHIARKLSQELGTSVRAEDVKLHAKGMLIGREAAGGEPIDPRVAHGSANFSVSGFERNVEGGRFYHRPELTKDITERIFDEIFARCRPVDKLAFVPLADRAALFDKVPLDTPIEDLSFMAYDLETTGFAAHFGDVPVSVSAIRESLQKTENPDGTVTWSRGDRRMGELDAKSSLGLNAFGSEQKVPKASAEIHGYTREKLAGEPPLQDALERFADLAQKPGKAAVPLMHNAKFDAPFLDLQYAKPQHPIGDINLQVVDQPMVCTMELAKEVLPFKPKAERAPGEPRQSYKLSVLAEQLAGREQSEIHDGFEDTDLALDVLVGLANARQARTLRDLLPRDKLYLETPGSEFTLYADPHGDRAIARFQNESDPRVRTVHGRSLRDGKEMFGAPKRIYDHEVLGFEGDRVHVRLTTSSGEADEGVTGWVPADQVRFYQAGSTYWGLREAGEHLRPPFQMSRGEFWRGPEEAERYAATAADPSASKPAPPGNDTRLQAQLAAAEAAFERAARRAESTGAEARELERLSRRAHRLASSSAEEREAAAARIARLRDRLSGSGGAR